MRLCLLVLQQLKLENQDHGYEDDQGIDSDLTFFSLERVYFSI
ncbi:hypothetical protein QEN48_00865 [Methanonatronarchaeum sp. AMET-Sl]|nr:hypothetical protein [Methanonatronarchaeum sp. AMET-Sl]WGI17591.1 hypothetical protein QEN48_00865 [Methanonatronarchaeum sp. AMET-Sl]